MEREEPSSWSYMVLPLKRYAQFWGRAPRREFWLYQLFWWLVYLFMFVILIVGQSISSASPGPLFWVTILAIFLWWAANLVPSLAVTVRRFHDVGLSGGVVALLVIVSVVIGFTWLAVIIICCLRGTEGPNKYGPDPLQVEDEVADVFA